MKASSNSLAAAVEKAGVVSVVLFEVRSPETEASIATAAEADVAIKTSRAAASNLLRRSMTEGNNWGLFDEKLKSGSLATFVVSTANFSWRGKLRICATDHREIAASAPLRANRHIYRSDRCAPFRSGAHDGVWRVTWSNDAEPIC